MRPINLPQNGENALRQGLNGHCFILAVSCSMIPPCICCLTSGWVDSSPTAEVPFANVAFFHALMERCFPGERHEQPARQREQRSALACWPGNMSRTGAALRRLTQCSVWLWERLELAQMRTVVFRFVIRERPAASPKLNQVYVLASEADLFRILAAISARPHLQPIRKKDNADHRRTSELLPGGIL